jgi:hypothetical protein
MNVIPAEAAQIHNEGYELRYSEVQELNELQLTLVGGGNVIVTLG